MCLMFRRRHCRCFLVQPAAGGDRKARAVMGKLCARLRLHALARIIPLCWMRHLPPCDKWGALWSRLVAAGVLSGEQLRELVYLFGPTAPGAPARRERGAAAWIGRQSQCRLRGPADGVKHD